MRVNFELLKKRARVDIVLIIIIEIFFLLFSRKQLCI